MCGCDLPTDRPPPLLLAIANVAKKIEFFSGAIFDSFCLLFFAIMCSALANPSKWAFPSKRFHLNRKRKAQLKNVLFRVFSRLLLNDSEMEKVVFFAACALRDERSKKKTNEKASKLKLGRLLFLSLLFSGLLRRGGGRSVGRSLSTYVRSASIRLYINIIIYNIRFARNICIHCIWDIYYRL